MQNAVMVLRGNIDHERLGNVSSPYGLAHGSGLLGQNKTNCAPHLLSELSCG